jgi:hypothetical protein
MEDAMKACELVSDEAWAIVKLSSPADRRNVGASDFG